MVLLRKAKNWSQTDLARQVGCSREIISKYEKDSVMPSVEMAKKIADAFGVSLDYLAGEGQNASFDKLTLQRIQDIQNLDPDTKTVLFNIIDTYLRDAKTRQAYAS
jgi:transcriptional regulator with XRE-family HTH domain